MSLQLRELACVKERAPHCVAMALKVGRVSIADPQRLGDGLTAFTSFKVTTTLLEPCAGLDGVSFTVVRCVGSRVW